MGEESESEDEGTPDDGGGSDYEPDEGYTPKKTASRGVRGSAKKRKRRGSDFSSDEDGSSSGEEWGKKRKGKGRRRKKKLSDSEEASMSSDDSEPRSKKWKKASATGYTKPVKLSEDLEAIVGVKEAPRHEVIKLMWAYIKDNNLQDPKNKQFAKCDDKLEKVIGEKGSNVSEWRN